MKTSSPTIGDPSPARVGSLPDTTESMIPVGVVGCLTFGMMGWSRLLVPSLIRSIEATFAQTDLSMGGYYLVNSLAYAVGAILGNAFVGRLGHRSVLALAAMVLGASLAGQGLAPSWPVFVLASVPGSLAAGATDAGLNGLFLDLFAGALGRPLSLLHLSFSVAALAAPLGVALLVTAGVAWAHVLAISGVAWFGVAGLLAVFVRVAPSRHPTPELETETLRAESAVLVLPLAMLTLAVGVYVGSEGGVSDWLVRYLAWLPLGGASLALSLFWAGMSVGRLAAAGVSHRIQPLPGALVLAISGSIVLAAAILAPSPVVQIPLFGLVGVCYGPVYPLMMAAGGSMFPGRSTLVTSALTTAAVAGSIAYPPLVGVMSSTVGLRVGMLGASLLGLTCAVMLLGVRAAARGTSGRAAGLSRPKKI